ncbi:MAG: hypothetical protein E5Y73_07545 [Mesorhizobium sp.]|uniref:hypothetical protein n=1 Tax=Mesorhizobium sp. TaxID=1871066 RepID=UPI0012243D7C|nr:hypothetical protein [Mesorhizobium sp.]TIL95204.1 MAG: hypothetical protein E5Y73_07545 [Mesorhizobium sp.]
MAVDALEGKRRAMLATATDAEIAAIDAEIVAANRTCERVDALRAETEKRLAAIETEEIETERRARFDAAKTATADAAKALKQYPAIAMQIVTILETVARAEVAIAAANAGLPVGEALLQSAELLARGLPPEPRELISEKRVDRWEYTGDSAAWGAVQESLIGDIQIDTAGLLARRGRSGTLRIERGNGPRDYRVARRTVLVRTWRESRSALVPQPLANAVNLPALHARGPELWRPVPPDGLVDTIGTRCERVLDAVAARRETAGKRISDPRPEPGTVIEEVPVDDDQAEEEVS